MEPDELLHMSRLHDGSFAEDMLRMVDESFPETETVKERLDKIPNENINGTDEEAFLISKLEGKRSEYMDNLRDEDLPLTDLQKDVLTNREWLWYTNVFPTGPFKGMYGGVMLDVPKKIPVLYVTPKVLEAIMDLFK